MFSFIEHPGIWFFYGCPGINAFWSCQIWSQKFSESFLYRALWTLNFLGRVGVWVPTFFGHTKFKDKKFSEFFHLQSILDSEFLGGEGPSTNFIWSSQIWCQKFVKIFLLLSALNCIFQRGSRHQLFLVMPNFRPKIFWNFFLYQVLLTLKFLGQVSGHQLFLVTLNWWSKFFPLLSALTSKFFLA